MVGKFPHCYIKLMKGKCVPEKGSEHMKSENLITEENCNIPEDKMNRKLIDSDSFQYNSQELDQEQRVDVNPVQLNTQNVNVYVKNEKLDYSCKISGTTILKENKCTVEYVNIYLYFGQKCGCPVFETNSDNNGNFIIENLPPGYYIIYAQLGKKLKYQSGYIKVLPGQNVHQTLLLSEDYSKDCSCRF